MKYKKKMTITLGNLKQASGRNDIICNNYVIPLNQTLSKYEINSPLRVCHFLAQIFQESYRFKFTLEEATGSEYEGRKDLGNVEVGDGIRFKGRGLIQITGRANYQALTDAIGKPNNVNFILNPELLQQPLYATMSAGWFWNSRKLNLIADQDDIRHITLHINGGYNGLDHRIAYLNALKKIFMPTVNTVKSPAAAPVVPAPVKTPSINVVDPNTEYGL